MHTHLHRFSKQNPLGAIKFWEIPQKMYSNANFMWNKKTHSKYFLVKKLYKETYLKGEYTNLTLTLELSIKLEFYVNLRKIVVISE